MTIKYVSLLGLALVVGCGSRMPKELGDARAAYQRASTGPAAQLNPAQLHVAQQSLKLAEKTYEDEGDSDRAKDRAYVATRKAELAEAQARLMAHEQEIARAEREGQANLARAAQSTQQQLNMSKEQLAAQRQQLEAERQAREAADKRAQEAADQLAKIAEVKREPRGVVITLSGGVLFPSGKAELLPTAQTKLNEVAKVLAKESPDQKIVVEGHTDSQGKEQMNQALSQKRAEAVRSYLTSHGVAPDRVTAQGKGPSQPVADNTSPEGRANNRRVEIIVQQPGTTE